MVDPFIWISLRDTFILRLSSRQFSVRFDPYHLFGGQVYPREPSVQFAVSVFLARQHCEALPVSVDDVGQIGDLSKVSVGLAPLELALGIGPDNRGLLVEVGGGQDVPVVPGCPHVLSREISVILHGPGWRLRSARRRQGASVKFHQDRGAACRIAIRFEPLDTPGVLRVHETADDDACPVGRNLHPLERARLTTPVVSVRPLDRPRLRFNFQKRRDYLGLGRGRESGRVQMFTQFDDRVGAVRRCYSADCEFVSEGRHPRLIFCKTVVLAVFPGGRLRFCCDDEPSGNGRCHVIFSGHRKSAGLELNSVHGVRVGVFAPEKIPTEGAIILEVGGAVADTVRVFIGRQSFRIKRLCGGARKKSGRSRCCD
mmetsp:Transcript_45186/g.88403  ORF Transcript_45186/g.88403 Transcript_45186/m.88403 type:complete len:370 (+) Transcript_45186:945-2054(+)